jgi:5-methylcytosine-specific restriction endonuclease McrA
LLAPPPQAAGEGKKSEYTNEEVLARRREIYREDIEKSRAQHRARYNNNPEKKHNRRSLERQAGEYTPQEWFELKKKYNYSCLCCGRREPDIKLTADHVVPLSRGGSNTIENIQPLCITCNKMKYIKMTDYRK